MMKKDAKAKSSEKVKADDIDNMSWNDLRAFAKTLDIPAKGTRSKLEAKIKEGLKLQLNNVAQSKNPKQATAKRDAAGSVSREIVYPIGQKVIVNPDVKDYGGIKGKVVMGDPIQVALEGGGQVQFNQSQLTKRPPILAAP